MLIKNRQAVADTWRVVGLSDGAAAQTVVEELGDGDVIVPLSVWQTHRVGLLARTGRTGVWLQPSDEPGDLLAAPPLPELIAVRFPAFTDGRGLSTARLLRERYGFRGELRAIGDILRDQLFELARCGFDAFALRADQDIAAALAAFDDFSEAYQAASDRTPLFARRFAADGAVCGGTHS
jgi:uncharacterized protein (DUF934 family)